MRQWLLALCIGFVLDLMLGDPYGIYHPVQAMGALISLLERGYRKLFHKSRGGERAAGICLVLTVLLVSGGVTVLLLYGAFFIHPLLCFALECLISYQMLAMKSLKVESMKVYEALNRKDIEGARHAVSMIVGRDTERLNAEGIAKAAVETVAENTSDGVIAPFFYMVLAGPLGGVLYKAVNTMDSMVGYKNEKYRYFGSAAAHLDDVVNFIPARLAALLLLFASCVLRLNAGNAWLVFRRDRYNHASPNSAQTESVCAGALEVQLAGDAWYFGTLYPKKTIGDPIRKVTKEDIVTANRMLYTAGFCCLALVMLFLL